MVILLGSPHEKGVTDRLGSLIAAGYGDPLVLRLREFEFAPCRGCQACLDNGGECILPVDSASRLFQIIQQARTLVIVAPIYFYALPGQLKSFIDRSQKYWGRPEINQEANSRGAFATLAAGRRQGDRLFAGALLTLKWFLMPFGFHLADRFLFRGLERVGDISGEIENDLRRFGKQMRKSLGPLYR